MIFSFLFHIHILNYFGGGTGISLISACGIITPAVIVVELTKQSFLQTGEVFLLTHLV